MARKSGVWDFFKVLEDDVSKAQCLLCTQSKVVVRRGGKTSKQFTTTNLRNHIRSKHQLHFKELSATEEEKAQKRANETVDRNQGETSGSARKALKNQMAIETSFDKARIWDINSSPAKKITKLIGEMMALDNQPFLMVEDLGFQRLMKHLAPSYQLPSRFHFSDKVIPNLFERAKKAIAEKLSDSESISFTTDIWTCQHTNNSYISLSAHWVLDAVAPMQSYVLHSSLFSGSHTGIAIASKFESMLETWNLPLSKCHMVITDNGANMVSGIQIADVTRGPCFLHTLQLAIHDGILSQRSVSDMIARSKRVVTHFNHSALACDRLLKIQENLNLPKKKLIQDVPTRWNSTFYLLQRLLEMKNAIVLYATDYDIQVPTTNGWKLMENVIRLLQPFEEYTKLLSSNNAPISAVIPAVAVLQHFLNKDDGDKSAGVRTMKREFHDAVKSRFEDVLRDVNYIVATTVDPRFKIAFTAGKGRELLLREVKKVMKPVEEIAEDDTASSEQSAHIENRADLWACFDELVASATSSATGPQNQTSDNSEEKEVSAFLAMPLLAKEECPFKWWIAQKSAFPNIHKVAKRFLSAPCSSVYSERIFSEAGNILHEKRSRLTPLKSESLLFLHHNLPRLEFDY